MKNVMLSMIILFSGISAMAQDPSQMQPVPAQLRSQLIDFHFAAESSLAQRRIQSGYAIIDLENRSINLTLFPSFYCPPNVMCAQVMPAPIEISLPLEKVEKGACNTVVYTAFKDLRPVDGPLETIRLTDNSRFYGPKNGCQSLVPVRPVEIQYSVEGGWRVPPHPTTPVIDSFGGLSLTDANNRRL